MRIPAVGSVLPDETPPQRSEARSAAARMFAGRAVIVSTNRDPLDVRKAQRQSIDTAARRPQFRTNVLMLRAGSWALKDPFDMVKSL